MLHTLFDKVYIISIPVSGEQRLTALQQRCQSIGLQYEVFPGVDGNNTPIQWDQSGVSILPRWTAGAAGLVYSTINLINDAKQKGYSKILILEDDVIFTPNINRDVKEAMEGLPSDWELFHLIAHHRKGAFWTAPRLQRIESSWSCQMYAIRESVYDLYLSELAKVNRPIDSITSEVLHPRGKSYCIIPAVVQTVPNFSFIMNQYFNHGV